MQTFARLKRFLNRCPLIISRKMELRQHIAAGDAIGKQRTVVLRDPINGDRHILKSLCTYCITVRIERRDLKVQRLTVTSRNRIHLESPRLAASLR